MREIISEILSFAVSALWMWGICQVPLVRKKRNWTVAIILLLFTGVLKAVYYREDMAYEVAFLILSIIVSICIVCVIFEEKKTKVIVKYLFSTFYVVTTYLLIDLVVLLCLGERRNAFRTGHIPFYDLLNCLFILLIGIYFKRHERLIVMIRQIPSEYYLLATIIAFMNSGLMNAIDMIKFKVGMREQLLISALQILVQFFVSCMGLGLGVIDMLKRRYLQDSLLKDEYLKVSQEHFDVIHDHMVTVRRMQHDMKHHLTVLRNYLEKGESEKAICYLENMSQHEQLSNQKTITMGNDIVDALVNHLLRADPTICFLQDGVLPPNLRLRDYDLCTIFSNILTNSITACKKLQTTKPEISSEIKHWQGNLLIRIKNPVEWKVDLKKTSVYPTKEEGNLHGYGLLNVSETVAIYHGEISYEQNGTYFSIQIFLPDVYDTEMTVRVQK